MKRAILTFILSITAISALFAQKTLNVEDVTTDTDVYPCADRKEMMAEFRCKNNIQLTFSSNYHKGNNVDILSVTEDSLGNQRIYRVVLPVEGKKGSMSLDRRVLTVYADGFNPVELHRFNHPPKTKKVYIVEDPYEKFNNPFYRALNDGARLYNEGNYEYALTQYFIARETPEYLASTENMHAVDSRINNIDSICHWRSIAENAYDKDKYLVASTYYQKILTINPADSIILKKYHECQDAYYTDCTMLLNTADQLYKNHQLAEAREYYQRVIDNQCFSRKYASDQVLFINKKLQDRQNKSQFLCYEYNADAPIGLSVGRYPMKGFGGFFTISTNANTFELIRNEPDPEKKPEVDVAFGWTHKIYPPIWIHFGPGYCGAGRYLPVEDSKSKPYPSSTNDEKYNLKWYNAIAPEVGLAFKLSYFTLRYTFQYRFALKSEDKDVLGKFGHFFGVGVAW